MSQLALDDQLNLSRLLPALRPWIPVAMLRDLRPDELILDDRAPTILRTLRQPTFVTIDQDFWDRNLCQPSYCILYFGLRDQEQRLIPDLLRALLRRQEFRTRAARMCKLARVTPTTITFWQYPPRRLHSTAWQGAARRMR
jgi:hypothetical protein